MRSWLLLVLVPVPPTTAVAPGAPVDRNAERVRPGPLERDTQRITFRRFGLQLLAEALARDPADSNRVLSPASAGLALSLVMAGARGSTASAIGAVLGTGGLDAAGIARRNRNLLDSVRNREDVTLEIATALWVDTSSRVRTAFRKAAAEYYRAAVTSIPLASPEVVVALNRWSDSNTHGRIPAIRDAPFDPFTRLAVTNAVYFKGKWAFPFQEARTGDRDFTLASGGRIRTRAMDQLSYYAYRRETGYQVLRIPYREDRAAMYVLLPDSGASVDSVVRRLAQGDGLPSLGWNSSRRVHLVLPRFRVEQDLDLKPGLAALGMGVAFNCEAADFSGLLEDRNGRPSLATCVDEADQKVMIAVDEEGAVAAAVTTLSVQLRGYTPPPEPIQFVVDRPFLFVLRDERTGADLFIGRIARPEVAR